MFNPLVYHRGDAITPKEGWCCREERRDSSPLPTSNARSCFQRTRLRKAWQPRPRLRAGRVVMPRHTGGRHAPRAGATGCRSLGSAWPTVSRSGRRIASGLRSHGGNHGTLASTGETPPGASGVWTPPGAPRMVAGFARRPWCPLHCTLSPYACLSQSKNQPIMLLNLLENLIQCRFLSFGGGVSRLALASARVTPLRVVLICGCH